MKRPTLHQSIPAAILAAAAALQTNGALAASSQTFKGATVSSRWGPIQVSIVVKNKRITNVKISASTHTARSGLIDGNALPILKTETLQAQSARIDQVSGATDLSNAYVQSLQGAIDAAKQHKALS